MHNVAETTHDEFPGDEPTHRELPSGRWVIQVDKGARMLEHAIARLEAGAETSEVIDSLREAHRLVDGVR